MMYRNIIMSTHTDASDYMNL